MSLQLTPFDSYALRPAVPPAADPPAAAPAAPVAAAAGAAPGDGAPGRSARESSAGAPQAVRAARAADAGRPAGASPAVDPDTVPSTVSLGKAPVAAAEAAAGQVPAKPEPPVSEQMLEFLQSMWKAGAQAITLPREQDGMTGPDAAGATGAGSGLPMPGAPAAAVAARPPADPAGARPAAIPVRGGEPPILGNALDDGRPVVAAPSAPLVYADPTVRRASGR
jgi:hypothetical protein